MKSLSKLFLIIILLFNAGLCLLPAQNGVWDSKDLKQTPDYQIISKENGVYGIIYKGAKYNGVRSDVFAYYCTPGILKGDTTIDKNLPAVVCVHGGGGKAYQQWVKMWAEKGFAAISMDLRGYGPDSTRLPNGFIEENFKTPYFTCNEDITKDWFYQAVASVVSAHSLLLSFKEVDPQRTAITGVSWGGIITTLVAGLDNRFKVACPVYGCGFLFQSGSMAPQIKRQPAFIQERWIKQYDPFNYLQSIQIPMLFVNGTNDNHFLLDQYTETVNRVKHAEISLRVGLKHGHGHAWQVPEVQNYIAYKLLDNNAVAPIQFQHVKIKKAKLSATLSNKVSKVFINYTNSETISPKAEWVQKEITFNENYIKCELPEEYKICFLSVEDKNQNRYSTKLYHKK